MCEIAANACDEVRLSNSKKGKTKKAFQLLKTS